LPATPLPATLLRFIGIIMGITIIIAGGAMATGIAGSVWAMLTRD